MAEYDLVKMQKKLVKYLDEERYQHTLGVMFTSASLAMVHGYDLVSAQCAGLLHDCAKCIPNKKKIRICEQHGVELTDFERRNPFLIHAKLGAYIARVKYGVRDPEILSAITYHTTGRTNMSMLEKIVYIADYIEPMRFKAPDLPRIRRIAFQDLDEGMYEILKSTVDYLGADPEKVDVTSLKAYDFYRARHNARFEDIGDDTDE